MGSFGERLQMMSVQLVPFFMAVVFHEFAHGWVANRCGDKTAQEKGRLTLNPLSHIDPIGTVLIPVFNMLSGINLLFGWAKPVPIDPRRFRKFRQGLFLVSIAGVTMNFLMAMISAASFCAIRKWVPQDFYLFEPLIAMAYVSVSINFALGIFNLIPLPPLDGSKVIESMLPYNAIRKYESLTRYSFFILMALMFSGAFNVLMRPINFCSNLTLVVMAQLFQLPEVAG